MIPGIKLRVLMSWGYGRLHTTCAEELFVPFTYNLRTGSRMGGPRHQTACVDELGRPVSDDPRHQTSCVDELGRPVRDDPRHQTSCVDELGLRQASYFVC